MLFLNAIFVATNDKKMKHQSKTRLEIKWMIDKRIDIIRQLTVKNANDFFFSYCACTTAVLASNADKMTGVVKDPYV